MTSLQIQNSDLAGARGKVVIITGGASGIGKAAVELFHSQGAKVMIADLNENLGNKLATYLGKDATFCVCDVTKWSSLYTLFETAIRMHGKVDIVIANAGVPEIEDIFTDSYDPATGKLQEPKYIVLDVNLKGVIATVKLAKHFFEKQKVSGSIVMTSSTGGFSGDAYLPAYTASKHGVLGLMRSVNGRADTPFAASNIRVNCVAPFMTESGFISDDLRLQLAKTGTPINDASSVAKSMAYLGVTEGVTGQTVYVADNKFTELEGPLRALRPQWLGRENANWLDPKFKMNP